MCFQELYENGEGASSDVSNGEAKVQEKVRKFPHFFDAIYVAIYEGPLYLK